MVVETFDRPDQSVQVGQRLLVERDVERDGAICDDGSFVDGRIRLDKIFVDGEDL